MENTNHYYQKPKTLALSAMETTLDTIGGSHSELKDLFRQLPQELIQDLLTVSFKKFDNSKSVTILVSVTIASLERTGIKVVKTPKYLHKRMSDRIKLLDSLRSSKIHIKELYLEMYRFLEGESHSGDVLEQIERTLLNDTMENHIHNITVLVIPTVADSKVFSVLCMCGNNLKVLDVSFSGLVTDDHVGIICTEESKCRNIEQIFLEGTNISKLSVQLLLNFQRNLSFVESPFVMEALHSYETGLNTTWNVRKITVNKTLRWDSSISQALKRCPLLKTLHIQCFGHDSNEMTSCLGKMNCLSHLNIAGISFASLVDLLTTAGKRLEILCYSNFSEHVDVGTLLARCLSLKSLAVNASCLSFKIQRDSNCNHPLKKLFLNVHALVGHQIWKEIFLGCTQIEYIDMTPGESMNDEAICNVLLKPRARPPLRKLKSFIVRGRHRGGDVRLTNLTISNLRRVCRNLNYVGDCSTWSLSRNDRNILCYRKVAGNK